MSGQSCTTAKPSTRVMSGRLGGLHAGQADWSAPVSRPVVGNVIPATRCDVRVGGACDVGVQR